MSNKYLQTFASHAAQVLPDCSLNVLSSRVSG